jgi:diaminohydroxyphosphoribosylaminopyrimidine deaminase/5-amino-6-(5-phosphoribosylamino)uracil reductase
MFADAETAPVFVFGMPRINPAGQEMLEGVGARIESVHAAGGGIDVVAVLVRLEEIGFGAVLAEGGGKLAASLIAADVVDRIEWFRAPMVLGAEGRPAVASLALAKLADAPRFKRVALRELGPDIWESYERVS